MSNNKFLKRIYDLNSQIQDEYDSSELAIKARARMATNILDNKYSIIKALIAAEKVLERSAMVADEELELESALTELNESEMIT